MEGIRNSVVHITSQLLLTKTRDLYSPFATDNESYKMEGTGAFVGHKIILTAASLVLVPPTLLITKNSAGTTINNYRFPNIENKIRSPGVMPNMLIPMTRILVTVNNIIYEAKLLMVDGAGGYALLKIEDTDWNVKIEGYSCFKNKILKWGKSRDLYPGSEVYVIGNVSGNTLISGVVSNARGFDRSGWILPELLIIDVNVKNYSVGSPIFNCEGEIVGLQIIAPTLELGKQTFEVFDSVSLIKNTVNVVDDISGLKLKSGIVTGDVESVLNSGEVIGSVTGTVTSKLDSALTVKITNTNTLTATFKGTEGDVTGGSVSTGVTSTATPVGVTVGNPTGTFQGELGEVISIGTVGGFEYNDLSISGTIVLSNIIEGESFTTAYLSPATLPTITIPSQTIPSVGNFIPVGSISLTGGAVTVTQPTVTSSLNNGTVIGGKHTATGNVSLTGDVVSTATINQPTVTSLLSNGILTNGKLADKSITSSLKNTKVSEDIEATIVEVPVLTDVKLVTVKSTKNISSVEKINGNVAGVSEHFMSYAIKMFLCNYDVSSNSDHFRVCDAGDGILFYAYVKGFFGISYRSVEAEDYNTFLLNNFTGERTFLLSPKNKNLLYSGPTKPEDSGIKILAIAGESVPINHVYTAGNVVTQQSFPSLTDSSFTNLQRFKKEDIILKMNNKCVGWKEVPSLITWKLLPGNFLKTTNIHSKIMADGTPGENHLEHDSDIERPLVEFPPFYDYPWFAIAGITFASLPSENFHPAF